ncbi:unnamed protein product [Moneuplotes crassus]|uniref:NAD(+) kinase n=1 Tax=Euplotes crassus TaxID=5936 RepID=A0AAD1XEQ8_EUPCR|nr:unnamed protein product [Moneuplotes crassus]
MERSYSTIDKTSSTQHLEAEEFTPLKSLPIKSLKVFIFMKPSKKVLDPYIKRVIEFLQRFSISCYVTEPVMQLLKESFIEPAEVEDDQSSSYSDTTKIDLDCIEIFSEENQSSINRIITLGGDGTVVQAIKLFVKDKCPEMITFGQESIGYLCCFEGSEYEEVLYHSLIKIAEDRNDYDIFIDFDEDKKYGNPYVEKKDRVVLKVLFDGLDPDVSSKITPGKTKKPKFGSLYALNQIIVDRGSFNYLTNLECYINKNPLTVIQGDGVILSSSTGSTSYNMSAGGSIVYNYVNCVLLTPICPHSLSFRPLILPDDCIITLKASEDSRAEYYSVSIDGDHTFTLKRGEKIDIQGSLCSLPFVTFNPVDPMAEWCKRLNSSLHWNSRPVQKNFTNQNESSK